MDNILVTRSSMPPMEEYIEEIKDMWDTHWLTNMGVKHKQLQQELINYMDVEYVELLVNGHMALEMTIQALGLKGEIITTPFTFASTTHAIVRNGCTPVFCDINPYDYTMDVTQIKSLITEKTVAILPVHVYGNVCNVKAIDDIAKEHGLKVVYDAAHTFGETYKGIGIGNYGDASCFSFHATKVFNTIEGGAVCYHDSKLGESLYNLKNFGIHGEDKVDAVGANAKMNEFAAAMGICNLRHVEEEIKKREAVYNCYMECLEGMPGIRLNYLQSDVKSNYAYFPIVIDEKLFGANRDEVRDTLAKEGIGARKYFYPLTSVFDCFKGQFNPGNTPLALDISNKVLTLPMYADLSLDDVKRICSIINNLFLRKCHINKIPDFTDS